MARVGRYGLRCCTQLDVQRIIAVCWDIRGRSDLALSHMLHDDGTAGREIGLWHLDRQLAAADLPHSYADTICRRMYRCSLSDATSRQIWSIVFMLRDRARRKSAQKSIVPQ